MITGGEVLHFLVIGQRERNTRNRASTTGATRLIVTGVLHNQYLRSVTT